MLPVLVKHDIGVLGMKPMGDGSSCTARPCTPIECLHYAMNLPTSVVITGIDTMAILEQALDAARTFKPMATQEVASLLAKTAPRPRTGEFERYKTTNMFDGTPTTRSGSGSAKIKASRMSDIKTCHGLRKFSRIRQTNQKQ